MQSKSLPNASDRFPPQVKYIVGNEACERFSFYGMMSILQLYVAQKLGAGQDQATEISHLFKSANYFMPLVGAWLADRFWGRYRSILWLSLFYCLGHAMMAIGEGTYWGLYTGLGLIALGSGGIKPSVSAFVGDQFEDNQAHLLRKAYGWFYWTVNFGSFFSFLVIPEIKDRFGYRWAFGVPGIFMGLATLIFWLGTKKYKHLPSAGDPPSKLLSAFVPVVVAVAFLVAMNWSLGRLQAPFWARLVVGILVITGGIFSLNRVVHKLVEHSQNAFNPGPFTVAWYAVSQVFSRKPGEGFWDRATQYSGAETVANAQAVLKVLRVLSLVPFFWALYDQNNSTWVVQGSQLAKETLDVGPWKLTMDAERMQSVNALFVMILVPIFTLGVYPRMDRIGWHATPLKRMAVGIFITALSFVFVGLLQQRIDALAAMDLKLSIWWQALPYFVLTAGEVLVSATGIEFAYTHAPKSLKSTMSGIWLLTISAGNLLVAGITWATRQSGGIAAPSGHAASASQFFRYAVLTFVVSAVFLGVIRRFHTVDGTGEAAKA